MRYVFKTLGGIGIGALVIAGLMFGGYYAYSYFGPRYEGVRRDIMIESRAYSEGQIREIRRLKLQYLQAKTDDERNTIRAMALHEAAAFDKVRLPSDLQSFITQLGG